MRRQTPFIYRYETEDCRKKTGAASRDNNGKMRKMYGLGLVHIHVEIPSKKSVIQKY